MNLEKFRTALEKIDKPPDFKAIVLREDPPNYLESMMNEQINPEFNKNWAKDLHEKSVSPEVDEAISRSRAASLCSIDPNIHQRLSNRHLGLFLCFSILQYWKKALHTPFYKEKDRGV